MMSVPDDTGVPLELMHMPALGGKCLEMGLEASRMRCVSLNCCSGMGCLRLGVTRFAHRFRSSASG